MDPWTFWTIGGGMFCYAVLRQIFLSYRAWKARRALRPAAIRNAGVLTDSRLRAFELTVIFVAGTWAAAIVAFTMWFVAASRGWLQLP